MRLAVSSDPLVSVAKAARARKRAEAAFRQALQAARDHGYSAAQIAGSAGIARQNVLKATTTPKRCAHHPSRLSAWRADDGTDCVACNDCGAVLTGSA